MTQWKFVYDYPPNSTVTIAYDGTAFGSPAVDGPIEGDFVIPLPLKTGLGAANAARRAHGYPTASFGAVTLRKPVGPKITEPLFIFSLPQKQLYVGVGVDTSTVAPL